MAGKMRFETIGSIGGLAALVLWMVLQQPSDRREIAKATACENEKAIVSHFEYTNLIREVAPKGADLDVAVYGKAWAALPEAAQIEIGEATYCPLETQGKGGIVRIKDVDGSEIARVVAGKWLSGQ
jgi:hypothetical protein